MSFSSARRLALFAACLLLRRGDLLRAPSSFWSSAALRLGNRCLGLRASAAACPAPAAGSGVRDLGAPLDDITGERVKSERSLPMRESPGGGALKGDGGGRTIPHGITRISTGGDDDDRGGFCRVGSLASKRTHRRQARRGRLLISDQRAHIQCHTI